MFEGLTCVYRSNVDLFFYVVGSSQENEVCSILYILFNLYSYSTRKQGTNPFKVVELVKKHKIIPIHQPFCIFNPEY